MKNWNVKGRKVIVRVDFNVPIKNGIITDSTRIIKSLETLKFLLDKGARCIIMSHLGRPLKERLPDGSIDFGKYSLKPVAEKLSELLGSKIYFAPDCGGSVTLKIISELKDGEAVLCENTRFQTEEEKGDANWAELLSGLGDYFVNDAFGAAHREHATTATIARFFDKDHRSFGFLMEAEVENGLRVLRGAEKPFTAILGGAKVSDKILLIENLMSTANQIIIGGGMAYTFLAAQGFKIGNSLCETEKLDLALELLDRAKSGSVDIVLPVDSVAADAFNAEANTIITADQNIPNNYLGLDIGPKSMQLFAEKIKSSKTIIWNGPMGVFEFDRFAEGTKAVAQATLEATRNGAFSLIGGGDSAAAANKFGLADQFSFVSTGGGAMLELLEGKILPGVEAIMS
ncbi:MAG: phosphoglycerate kinase [Saprospiraceae bacterium]|nr:phosphoglycerate kinase [Saprospiraceae bacterium]